MSDKEDLAIDVTVDHLENDVSDFTTMLLIEFDTVFIQVDRIVLQTQEFIECDLHLSLIHI